MTEHKRLTTKEKYPHGAEGVSKDKLTGKYCRGVFEATACVEKLAEYETAEEEKDWWCFRVIPFISFAIKAQRMHMLGQRAFLIYSYMI